MKTTLINRIRLTGVASMMAVVGAVGLLVPAASAVSVTSCELPCSPDPVVDTIAPTVNISNPTGSVKRGQSVLITALGSDNVGVTYSVLYVDDTLVDSGPGSASGATWTPDQKGTYTITALAYDAAGNEGVATKTVTVK